MRDWWLSLRLRFASWVAGAEYLVVDAERFDGVVSDLEDAEWYLSHSGSLNDRPIRRRALKRLHRRVGRALADALNAEGFVWARMNRPFRDEREFEPDIDPSLTTVSVTHYN